jgi:S1-C subfamily serine protease
MTDPTRPDDAPMQVGQPAVTPSVPPETGPAPSAEPGEPVGAFSPPPAERPLWPDLTRPAAQPRTPERWFEPVATGAVTHPVRAPRRPRGLLPALLGVSLLSAILAVGGTVGALQLSGALDRGSTTGSAPAATEPAGQPASSSRSVTIDEQSAVIAAAERVSPAVVTITTGGTVNSNGELPETGVGSGIIFDAAGWVLTNRHVVCGSETVSVELRDKRTFEGRVYGIDTLTDLAIVKLSEASGLPTAPIGDSSALKPGQLAIAIGSPLGEFTNSVTSGVVSALGRPVTVGDVCGQGTGRTLRNLVQTDAAINPGNSGGALVDSSGQVIGVNTAVAGRAQGIGFAIPVNLAKPMMEQALAGEELSRPWLGVFFADVTPNLVKEEQLPIDYGAWIGRGDDTGGPAVVADGPGARAGLKDGDIITAIDGQRVDLTHPLDLILSERSPGDVVKLDVLRNGEPLSLTVTLGTRPSDL